MKTFFDSIACAVIRQPSISRCGTRAHDLAVLERARLGLVRVDDEVRRLPGSARSTKLALRPVGKPAPPRPRSVRRDELVDQLVRRIARAFASAS